MKKYIALAAVLIVLGGVFYFNPAVSERLGWSFPLIKQDDPGSEAFSVFERYRDFAKEDNLEGIRTLSYQLSDACLNEARREECSSLMQTVYSLTESFKKEDFKHVVFDDKQLVIFTDYLKEEGSDDEVLPIRWAIFFVRTDEGPKVLGLKFCLPNEADPGECVETDPNKRDKNQNGWWDQVESLFKKK